MQRVVVVLALVSLAVMVLFAGGCGKKIQNKPKNTDYSATNIPGGEDFKDVKTTTYSGKCAVCGKESTELTEMWAAPFVPGQLMEDRKVAGACSTDCKRKFLKEGAKGFVKDERTQDWVPDPASPPEYATLNK